MARKLKVFRMAIGFEDAYVAAPSRKAALTAWGATHDQFARGVAEEVTDPKLTAAPLAAPGTVIRLSRGDLAAQLKALPPAPARAKTKATAPPPPVPKRKPKPPPKRTKLDAADAAVAAARERQAAAIAKAEAELAAMKAAHTKELAELTARRDAARANYNRALERWGEGA